MKEQIQAAYQPLTYKAIPRMMIRCLAMNQANQLNLFPVKGGVASYHSPCMILKESNLDYAKHCPVPFGAYIRANHETMKTSLNVTKRCKR